MKFFWTANRIANMISRATDSPLDTFPNYDEEELYVQYHNENTGQGVKLSITHYTNVDDISCFIDDVRRLKTKNVNDISCFNDIQGLKQKKLLGEKNDE